MDATTLDAICTAIQQAWDDGCPIAPYTRTEQEKMAQVAWRRWHSWQRRRVKPDLEARVRDLTNGLIQSCGAEPVYVGRLKTDWEYLARSIVGVLARPDG